MYLSLKYYEKKNTDCLYRWTTSCLTFQLPAEREMSGQLTVQDKKRVKTKFSVCVSAWRVCVCTRGS